MTKDQAFRIARIRAKVENKPNGEMAAWTFADVMDIKAVIDRIVELEGQLSFQIALNQSCQTSLAQLKEKLEEIKETLVD